MTNHGTKAITTPLIHRIIILINLPTSSHWSVLRQNTLNSPPLCHLCCSHKWIYSHGVDVCKCVCESVGMHAIHIHVCVSVCMGSRHALGVVLSHHLYSASYTRACYNIVTRAHKTPIILLSILPVSLSAYWFACLLRTGISICLPIGLWQTDGLPTILYVHWSACLSVSFHFLWQYDGRSRALVTFSRLIV